LAAAPTEEKYVSRKWIPSKTFLHLQRQRSHTTPHVGVTGGKPDPHSGSNRYHRNARKVTVTRLAGAVTPMLTRVPSDSSTLIAVLSSDVVFIGIGRGSSTTTAGANDVSPQLLDSAC